MLICEYGRDYLRLHMLILLLCVFFCNFDCVSFTLLQRSCNNYADNLSDVFKNVMITFIFWHQTKNLYQKWREIICSKFIFEEKQQHMKVCFEWIKAKKSFSAYKFPMYHLCALRKLVCQPFNNFFLLLQVLRKWNILEHLTLKWGVGVAR